MKKENWVATVAITIIMVIVLGSMFDSGLMVLFGDAFNKVPGGLCDTYYGLTHEKSITPDSKIFGIPLVNKENNKIFGIFAAEYPIECRLSTGGQVLSGDPVDNTGGIDWEDSVESVIPDASSSESTGENVTTQSEGRSPQCVSALAKLIALRGSTDPYAIRDAANTVLAYCSAEDQGDASAALVAAETAIVELENETARVAKLKDDWLAWQSAIVNAGVDYHVIPSQVRELIKFAGGTYQVQDIEGLWPGVMKNYVGGAETVIITVSPPAEISSDPEVSYITLKTTFNTLVEFGIGKVSSGVRAGEVPDFPATYTLP